MTTPYPPTTDLVAVAWLKSVLGPFSAVGTTLPTDRASWPDGFVQVLGVGGTPHVELPVRRPVVSVDCWVAPTQTSNSPRWGQASVLAERVRLATEDKAGPRVVVLTGNYRPAVVMSAWAATEPRRIPDDSGGYAHYSLDVGLHWREAT
jgi:hypothetical protein